MAKRKSKKIVVTEVQLDLVEWIDTKIRDAEEGRDPMLLEKIQKHRQKEREFADGEPRRPLARP